jgi:hypothetical protein
MQDEFHLGHQPGTVSSERSAPVVAFPIFALFAKKDALVTSKARRLVSD